MTSQCLRLEKFVKRQNWKRPDFKVHIQHVRILASSSLRACCIMHVSMIHVIKGFEDRSLSACNFIAMTDLMTKDSVVILHLYPKSIGERHYPLSPQQSSAVLSSPQQPQQYSRVS